MYEESIYSHNQRMKRLLKERIEEEHKKYWDCDRDTCYSNEYNAINCSNCPITTHNNKIKERIKIIKEDKL